MGLGTRGWALHKVPDGQQISVTVPGGLTPGMSFEAGERRTWHYEDMGLTQGLSFASHCGLLQVPGFILALVGQDHVALLERLLSSVAGPMLQTGSWLWWRLEPVTTARNIVRVDWTVCSEVRQESLCLTGYGLPRAPPGY